MLIISMRKGLESTACRIARLRLRRLVPGVLIIACVISPAGAERGLDRRRSSRGSDVYRVLLEDGSEAVGKSIDRWEDYRSTSVSGRRLFDTGRPARLVRNTSRRIASPHARVILVNGDIVPGRIIGVERAEDIPGRPVCLRVMSSASLWNGRTPKAGVAISPQYVSRIITGTHSAAGSRPGAVMLQSGSLISCQGMQWTDEGLRVLTSTGSRTCRLNDLAGVHMLQTDAIARILDDSLAPCPQRDSVIASLTTAEGARLTFRPAMMKVHDKRLVIQPVWSFSAIFLPLDDIRRLSIRRYNEVPLSMLPVETLAEKAYTGFVWKWRRDRSVRGGPLVSGSLIGDHGLGTHAYSAIAFDLPRCVESFSFHAGLDNSVGSGGCVKLKYDDSSWKTGCGIFAGKGEAGMRTEWPTKDIWIRKSFNLSEITASDIVLTVKHDDAAEVYLNGVLAGLFPGASYESYSTVSMLPKAKAALRVGRNVIAAHCNDVGGRRYIDVGLIDSTQGANDDPHVVSRRIRYMPELAEGMVRVLGKHARISGGGGARFDRELNAVAYWWRGKTWFSWPADVPKGGKYVVQLTYGCLFRAAGSTFEIGVGGERVRGVVRATGRWATFTTDDVGVVELKKGGPTTISIRLVKTPGNGIMTLHAVTLVPVK